MTRPPRPPLYAAGVIERPDLHVLIVLTEVCSETERLWRLPRFATLPGESPEAALRRGAEKELGLTPDVMIGQPPLLTDVEGAKAELRYFFCGVIHAEAEFQSSLEMRWVAREQLREYDFDAASQPVVDWLLNG
ncbi:MAG: NUDIX domain-containing protein [Planctomycetota bacterium]